MMTEVNLGQFVSDDPEKGGHEDLHLSFFHWLRAVSKKNSQILL
jgi:hypothetical protein